MAIEQIEIDHVHRKPTCQPTNMLAYYVPLIHIHKQSTVSDQD